MYYGEESVFSRKFQKWFWWYFCAELKFSLEMSRKCKKFQEYDSEKVSNGNDGSNNRKPGVWTSFMDRKLNKQMFISQLLWKTSLNEIHIWWSFDKIQNIFRSRQENLYKGWYPFSLNARDIQHIDKMSLFLKCTCQISKTSWFLQLFVK